jgi:Cys-tRNA(Pro)/Cys-tRNA(Cys) deacylase
LRSCSDVHNFLLEQGIAHEIVHLPALSTTAKRAADLLGVPQRDVVKSLLFSTDKGPVVALVPGDAQVNPRLLRQAAKARKIALAAPGDVLSLTGYRPGAMPPCGLAVAMPAIADPAVFESEVVYCGGGTTTTMLKIRSEDLRVCADPLVARIVD